MYNWRAYKSEEDIRRMEDLLDGMSGDDRETAYRLLRESYVKEDVEAELERDREEEGLTDEEFDAIASSVATRYVGGEYDNNLTYWDNLSNLIVDEINQRNAEQEKD